MRKLILQLLEKHGPMTAAEMADRMGTSHQHMNYYIRVLQLPKVGEKHNKWLTHSPIYGLPQ